MMKLSKMIVKTATTSKLIETPIAIVYDLIEPHVDDDAVT